MDLFYAPISTKVHAKYWEKIIQILEEGLGEGLDTRRRIRY